MNSQELYGTRISYNLLTLKHFKRYSTNSILVVSPCCISTAAYWWHFLLSVFTILQREEGFAAMNIL